MRPEDSLDKKLNIHTVGRDDAFEDDHHFPYEPTPYAVLELLADSGWIGEENLLLDYGCGKGRASFYLSSATGCRSIGVDFNEGFIAAAEQISKAPSLPCNVDGLPGGREPDRLSLRRGGAL